MDQDEFNRLDRRYRASGESLLYAISPRLGSHLAERFQGLVVLECCSGAGFLTMELAKVAQRVVSVEMDEKMLKLAKHNIRVAGVESKVMFVEGDVLSQKTLAKIPEIDAAILDPVWGQTISSMSPPADQLFQAIKTYTHDIALILPPSMDQETIDSFCPDEIERLYLDGEFALLCLYFGNLARRSCSEFRV